MEVLVKRQYLLRHRVAGVPKPTEDTVLKRRQKRGGRWARPARIAVDALEERTFGCEALEVSVVRRW